MTTDTPPTFDPYNDVGLAHQGKMDYWTVYTFFNFLGSFFCVWLIIAVYRLVHRTSNDILAGALCFSCMMMSVPCGIQCISNAISGHFAFGTPACYAEAIVHLVAITTLCMELFLLSCNSYRTIVQGESLTQKQCFQALALIWVVCCVGVGLFSIPSPIYMAPSGLFCFFRFDSVLMYAFFLPVFVFTFMTMVVLYYRIFRITRDALRSTHANVSDSRKNIQMRLAQKLFAFVLVFLISWTTFCVGVLLQLIVGDIFELDAIGGVLAVIHTLLVPLCYGAINPRLREQMFSCQFNATPRETEKDDQRGSICDGVTVTRKSQERPMIEDSTVMDMTTLGRSGTTPSGAHQTSKLPSFVSTRGGADHVNRIPSPLAINSPAPDVLISMDTPTAGQIENQIEGVAIELPEATPAAAVSPIPAASEVIQQREDAPDRLSSASPVEDVSIAPTAVQIHLEQS